MQALSGGPRPVGPRLMSCSFEGRQDPTMTSVSHPQTSRRSDSLVISSKTSSCFSPPSWKIHRSSLVLFKGSFKDPRYCSLGFLEALVKMPSRRIRDHAMREQ